MCLRGCTAELVAEDDEGAYSLFMHLCCFCSNLRSRHRRPSLSVASYARHPLMECHRSTPSSRQYRRRRVNRPCGHCGDADRSCIVHVSTTGDKMAMHSLYVFHVCCISDGKLTGCGLGVGQWPFVSAFTSISTTMFCIKR